MIEAMATATRTAWRSRGASVFLGAVLAVAVGPFGAGPASAAAACAAQTRVGASHSTVGVVVGSSTGITASRRLVNDPPRAHIVVATGVAPKHRGPLRGWVTTDPAHRQARPRGRCRGRPVSLLERRLVRNLAGIDLL